VKTFNLNSEGCFKIPEHPDIKNIPEPLQAPGHNQAFPCSGNIIHILMIPQEAGRQLSDSGRIQL
jgi:hypothetical protein